MHTLEPDINLVPVSDRDDPSIQSAIKLMDKNRDVKILRDNRNFMIQTMLEEGFEVADPTGTRKISPQMLQQAFWRTANRMKPLDFQIHGVNSSEELERIVTEGVATVMDNGGFVRALRDKEGAFHKLLAFGDGMVYVGYDKDNQFSPICFSPVSNSNIYVDSYATGIRSGGVGRSVNEIIVIFSMSYAEAQELFPNYKKKIGIGRLPRDLGLLKELERNYLQTFKLTDITEVGYYYNLSQRNYTCFVGLACTKVMQLKGDKFPFVLKRTKRDKGIPYVPILQFICWPAFEGFWNHGLGDMFYKLAVIQKRLMNMATGHIEDNTYPLTLINVPQGEAAAFFNKLQLAHEMRAVGKKGVVAMEYDPSNPNGAKVSAESLLTQNLMNEWQIIFERLDREVSRLGVNLDDIERGANVTASQIISEEENANAFVKQIQEYNASEMKFAVELTMDFIRKFIDKDNKTPINLKTRLNLEKRSEKLTNITLGDVADELHMHNYFVTVNARSGAVPSGIMEQTQIERVMAKTAPGTQAWYTLLEEWTRAHGRDIPMEAFMPQGQAPQVPTEEQGKFAPPVPTQTDRLIITPRATRQPQIAL